jgi:hypothetical protein
VPFKELSMKSMLTCGRFCVALLALGLVGLCVPCRSAESKKQSSSERDVKETTFEVDPCGQPLKTINGPRFYVWYDNGVWHVRTHTVSRRHEFTGVILLRGGKVARVSNFEGMEAHAKKANRDVGIVSDKGRKISFRLVTAGGEDGFDFRLSKAVTAVTFAFRFDGTEHPEVICVGSNCLTPPNATFTLPSNPEKPSALSSNSEKASNKKEQKKPSNKESQEGSGAERESGEETSRNVTRSK